MTADLTAMAWFRVRFPDRGAGATRIHAFVQGTSEDDVRERAQAHDHFRSYDPTKGDVSEHSARWDDIELSLIRASGPNVAINQMGDVIRRSDVRDD